METCRKIAGVFMGLAAVGALAYLMSTSRARADAPLIWYAANVGQEGFACRPCTQQFAGCGCDGWLSCQGGICQHAGNYGEPCRLDDPRVVKTFCLGDLGCVDDTCVPVGTEGETCRTEALYFNPLQLEYGQPTQTWEPACNPGLYCNGFTCYDIPLPPPLPSCAGEEGCECREAERRIEGCDAELICDQDRECRDLWALTFRALRASNAAYLAEDGEKSQSIDQLKSGGMGVNGLREYKYSGELGASLLGATDAEALIAADDNLIVVAVVGSESGWDWINDADIADFSGWSLLFGGVGQLDGVDMVDPYDKYQGGWMPCVANGDQSGCNLPKFKVHEKFLEYAHLLYWNFVEDQLRVMLQTKPRPIQVVGHSLGGAVAQLIAGQIVTHLGHPVDAVVTFGSPKVGDADWEAAYESLLHRATHRWVMNDDPVPNLPPRDDWKRAGQQHYIDKSFDTYTLSVVLTAELDSSNHQKSFRDVEPDEHSLMKSYLPSIEAVAPCDHPLNPRTCPQR